ncbi:tetratricopeptide repeat protein [Aureliella helgolandensis]|uniref:Tetratricopeptide repeat protein n=1 Tax=Aureliella helgolandensis TaxID=2527968 RepID=A0A518G1Q6_9BACT|nr:tetratricopeptide repeat protein [Aureliella helgolandensis]QDV22504.1 Tetratricopeptide repeat protein [Aureliella helgolandensis]
MRIAFLLLGVTWSGLWLTADQAGQRYFQQKKYSEAAQSFLDPEWQGTAWYRAGEFEKAVQAFSRVPSAEGKFNEGNAWLMLGKYDTAIASYDQALKRRASWKEAEENRRLAEARNALQKQEGGDLGDQRLGADKIVFDKRKKGGQETQVDGQRASSDALVQSIWLRQVHTQPADFLKAKFSYQHAQSQRGQTP